MATNTTIKGKRFVFRSSDKVSKAYFVPIDRSGSNVSSKTSPKTTHVNTDTPRSDVTPARPVNTDTPRSDVTPARLVNTDTPRSDVTPARRVIVVRNTKNSQVNQGPVDLGDFGNPDSAEIAPVVTNGDKSIYLIRRPISQPEPNVKTD